MTATTAFIPFLVVKRLLADRLKASPEEIAVWIFLGPQHGGLAAYEHVNEFEDPPRFYFDYTAGPDYLEPLVRCWFKKEEVDRFNPPDRFVTGQQLINRWSNSVNSVNKFIEQQIAESRLLDLHPTFGGTQWTEDGEYPTRESALFELAKIEAIEHENGISGSEPLPALPTTSTSNELMPTQALMGPSSPLTSDAGKVEG